MRVPLRVPYKGVYKDYYKGYYKVVVYLEGRGDLVSR